MTAGHSTVLKVRCALHMLRKTMIKGREIWRRITSAPRWKTRYTRALETELAQTQAHATRQRAEIAQLRDENRALLNSILGIAGIPPIYVSSHGAAALETSPSISAEAPRSAPSVQSGPEVQADSNPADTSHPRGTAAASEPASPLPNANEPSVTSAAWQTGAVASSKKLSQVGAPMRKRSWQQINRALEYQAARKKPEEQCPAGEI